MSIPYKIARDRILREAEAEGARVFVGQWGNIVIQYDDYYLVGSGLSFARNSGTWKPWPTYTGEMPAADGTMRGELRWSEDGSKVVAWINGEWKIVIGREDSAA